MAKQETQLEELASMYRASLSSGASGPNIGRYSLNPRKLEKKGLPMADALGKSRTQKNSAVDINMVAADKGRQVGSLTGAVPFRNCRNPRNCYRWCSPLSMA